MSILFILACIIIKLHNVVAIQPEIMYSFGLSSNDITLPKNDYGPIRLNFKLRFFNKVYSKIYVYTNGLISFLSPFSNILTLSIQFQLH